MRNLKFVLSILALFLFAGSVSAQEPYIGDVRITKNHELIASFAVKNAFTKEIEEAIGSGVPISFTFIVELNRKKGLWFDSGVARWEFRHAVKYDTLRKEYEITLDERNGVLRTQDFDEMKRLMSTGDSVALLPTWWLKKGSYDLRIMAELKTLKLPFLLDYLFFFLRFWDFETPWHTSSFSN